MKLLQKMLLALAAGSIMTVGAQAAVQPYIGAKIGYYDLDDAKDEAFSYGGYLGLQFTPEVGLEAEYITTKKEDFYKNALAGDRIRYKGENYGLYATYKHPITGSNLYAKGRLGVAHNKVKLENRASVYRGKRSESDTGIGGGLGFGYNFAPNAAVELAYEWYPKVDDVNQTGMGDRDLRAEGVTLGAHFKF